MTYDMWHKKKNKKNCLIPFPLLSDFVRFCQFMSVSVCFCLFLSVLFGFSPFLSALLVSVNFCLFMCVSVCFCPFLSVSVSFCQFRLVSVCFCPFLFVAVHFCPYLSVQVYFWHRRYYPHTSRDSVSPVCATCCGNLLGSCVQFSLVKFLCSLNYHSFAMKNGAWKKNNVLEILGMLI